VILLIEQNQTQPQNEHNLGSILATFIIVRNANVFIWMIF